MLATVYEIGHFLDHQGIGPMDEPASRRHPDLSEWRQLVLVSAACKALSRFVGLDE